MKKRLVLYSLLLGTLFMFGCCGLVNKMAFHPDKVSYVPPERLPSHTEELFITTADGIKIQSYYVRHKSSKKLVIFFHGNAGNISHRISDLLRISQCGASVLGVSYRGYGKSDGRPTEKGIYRDGEAAFNYAVNKLGFNVNDIYIFGRSIGTTAAINTAQNKNLAGLILVTPLTSAKAQAKTTGLGALAFMAGGAFNNIGKVENITCPTLVIHGTEDRVISYNMGVELFEAIKAKKKLITIRGAGHNNIAEDFAKEYWAPIFKFITSQSVD